MQNMSSLLFPVRSLTSEIIYLPPSVLDEYIKKIPRPEVFRLKNYPRGNLFILFHLYPPVTRKRRWRYILDELIPA